MVVTARPRRLRVPGPPAPLAGLRRRVSPPAVALLVVVAGWYLFVRLTRMPDFILPTPDRIVAALVQERAELLRHALVTLQEIGIGLVAGTLVGLGVAILLAWSEWLEGALMPWLVVFNNMPKVVVAPLLVLWFGFGVAPKVLLVVFIVFFPILMTTITGLRSVETDMVDLVRSMGASKWQLFVKARLPTALPYFFSGLKVSATLAGVGAVAAEWIGAEAGLGYLLLMAHDNFATGLLFAAFLVMAVIGLTLYQLVITAERLLLPWHVSARQSDPIAM